MKAIEIRTGRRQEMLDITAAVEEEMRRSGVERGACLVFVPHTTAGVTVNENADPTVREDVLSVLDRLVPAGVYAHAEGNSPAHAKASLVGSFVLVPVEGGRLALGTWQGVFFCEFDGPRSRRVMVRVLPG